MRNTEYDCVRSLCQDLMDEANTSMSFVKIRKTLSTIGAMLNYLESVKGEGIVPCDNVPQQDSKRTGEYKKYWITTIISLSALALSLFAITK